SFQTRLANSTLSTCGIYTLVLAIAAMADCPPPLSMHGAVWRQILAASLTLLSRIRPSAIMPLRARINNANFSDMPTEQAGDESNDVLFNSRYGVRTIELNRPKKLNSLNGSMARKILSRLKE
ncbi:hypothetical protein KCV03_g10152, partial [Aureobasidium melanogenum]